MMTSLGRSRLPSPDRSECRGPKWYDSANPEVGYRDVLEVTPRTISLSRTNEIESSERISTDIEHT